MTARSMSFLMALLATLAPGPGRAAGVDFLDRKPGLVSADKLTPGRPPATHFGTNREWACPPRGLNGFFGEELAQTARSNRRPEPRSDGRLCAVAEAFLAWDPKVELPEAVVSAVSRYYGIPTAPVRVILETVESEEQRTVVEQSIERLARLAAAPDVARWGMASQRLRRGVTRVAFATWDGRVELDPVPRRLRPGEKAPLAGRLLGDWEKPRLQISDARGRLVTPPAAAGNEFRGEIECGDRSGTIWVAIGGELGGSPGLLATFPIACGGGELAGFVTLAPPEPWPAETAKQERKMLELINAERTAAGLGPLAWDEALAGVARGVAESLRKSSVVPDDLTARMRQVGIASPVVAHNPAQGRSAEALQEQLSSSPPHRANMMNPELNDVGIGVVAGTGADGAPSAWVSQVFIRELPPLDPAATREKLRAAVVQRRKDGRYPAAAPDAGLDEFAQTFAQELAAAAGSLPKGRQAELTKPLDKRFKSVSLTFGARQDPLDFAEDPEVTAAGRVFGVGVALGMHEKLGRNAVYAAVVVGQERGGKEEPAPAPKKGKKK